MTNNFLKNVAEKSKNCCDHVVKIWLKVNKKYPKDIPKRTLYYKNCFLKSYNFKNPFFLKCFNFKKRKFQNFACSKPEVWRNFLGSS